MSRLRRLVACCLVVVPVAGWLAVLPASATAMTCNAAVTGSSTDAAVHATGTCVNYDATAHPAVYIGGSEAGGYSGAINAEFWDGSAPVWAALDAGVSTASLSGSTLTFDVSFLACTTANCGSGAWGHGGDTLALSGWTFGDAVLVPFAAPAVSDPVAAAFADGQTSLLGYVTAGIGLIAALLLAGIGVKVLVRYLRRAGAAA